MQKMKKIMMIFLLLATFFFLAACENTKANDQKAVDQVYSTLEISYQNPDNHLSVTKKIDLLLEKDGVNISWISNKENVISNLGEVVRQEDDETVILTASLTKGEAKKDKPFTLIVTKKEEIKLTTPTSHDEVDTQRESLNIIFSDYEQAGSTFNTLQKIAFIRGLTGKVAISPNSNFSLNAIASMYQSVDILSSISKDNYMNKVMQNKIDLEFKANGQLATNAIESKLAIDLLLKGYTSEETNYKDLNDITRTSFSADGKFYLIDQSVYANGFIKAFGSKGALVEIDNNINEISSTIFDILAGQVLNNVVYPDFSDITDLDLQTIFDTLNSLKIYKNGNDTIINYSLKEDDIRLLLEEMFEEEAEINSIIDQLINNFNFSVKIKLDQQSKLKSVYLETDSPFFFMAVFGGTSEAESSIKLELIFDTDEPIFPSNLESYQDIDTSILEDLNKIHDDSSSNYVDYIYNFGEEIIFLQDDNYNYYNYDVEITVVTLHGFYEQTHYLNRNKLNLSKPGTYTYNDGDISFEYKVVDDFKQDDFLGVYEVKGSYEQDYYLYAFFYKMGVDYYVHYEKSNIKLTKTQLFDLYKNLDVEYDDLALVYFEEQSRTLLFENKDFYDRIHFSRDLLYLNYYFYQNDPFGYTRFEKVEGQTEFPPLKSISSMLYQGNKALFDINLREGNFVNSTFLVTYDNNTTEIINYNDLKDISISFTNYMGTMQAVVSFDYKNISLTELFNCKKETLIDISGVYLMYEHERETVSRAVIYLENGVYSVNILFYSGYKYYLDVEYSDFYQNISKADDSYEVYPTNNYFLKINESFFYDIDLLENGFMINRDNKYYTEEYIFEYIEEVPRYLYDHSYTFEIDRDLIKTTYYLGEELDYSNLKLNLVYEDGTTYPVKYYSHYVYTYNDLIAQYFSSIGEKTLFFSFSVDINKNFTYDIDTTLEVTVLDYNNKEEMNIPSGLYIYETDDYYYLLEFSFNNEYYLAKSSMTYKRNLEDHSIETIIQNSFDEKTSIFVIIDGNRVFLKYYIDLESNHVNYMDYSIEGDILNLVSYNEIEYKYQFIR